MEIITYPSFSNIKAITQERKKDKEKEGTMRKRKKKNIHSHQGWEDKTRFFL